MYRESKEFGNLRNKGYLFTLFLRRSHAIPTSFDGRSYLEPIPRDVNLNKSSYSYQTKSLYLTATCSRTITMIVNFQKNLQNITQNFIHTEFFIVIKMIVGLFGFYEISLFVCSKCILNNSFSTIGFGHIELHTVRNIICTVGK